MAKNIETRLERLEQRIGDDKEITAYWISPVSEPDGWKSGDCEWRLAKGESDDELKNRVLRDVRGGGAYFFIGFRGRPRA